MEKRRMAQTQVRVEQGVVRNSKSEAKIYGRGYDWHEVRVRIGVGMRYGGVVWRGGGGKVLRLYHMSQQIHVTNAKLFSEM